MSWLISGGRWPSYVEEDRRKKKGIRIPDTAAKDMQDIVIKAVSEFADGKDQSEIKLRPAVNRRIESIEEQLLTDLSTSAKKWLGKSGYSAWSCRQGVEFEWTTKDEIKVDIVTIVVLAFVKITTTLVKYQKDIPLDSDLYLLLEDCEQSIITKLEALTAGWK